MPQPVFLQAFASTPVQISAPQQASGSAACADCGGASEDARVAQPVDELELSAEALAAAEQAGAPPPPPPPPPPGDEADLIGSTSETDLEAAAAEDEGDRQVSGQEATEADDANEAGSDLTVEEQDQVTELKSRDREVRSHEQAHIAAAGPYATGGPSYSYQQGPDGRRYAVGGEVGIDTSPVSGDPEATIQKAQQIRAAALAPASPSGQDQQVAAAATQMESQARAELSKQNQAKPSTAASYEEAEEEDVTGMLLDLVA
jgi:SprA family protein